MGVVWSRRKAREAGDASAHRSALVSVWRGALGPAWWLAPLGFCAAATFFGFVWLMKWPTLGAHPGVPAAPAILVFVLLMSFPAFGLFTTVAAPLPRLLRPLLLAGAVSALVLFAI